MRDADGNGLGVYGQRFGFTTGRQGSEFAIYVPAESERPTHCVSSPPRWRGRTTAASW